MLVKDPKRILFVNSEMSPFLPETLVSGVGRHLPQGIMEAGKEIRAFLPRYGCINERRNQLHEVIRLSGMNIVVNSVDRPLVIKVSSVPAARMQAYFIDNEDYFKRKQVFTEDDGTFLADNDERASFFARGILETVKKLRWPPDIIHCNGWISHLLPLYLKKIYRMDPIFANSKVVLSLYDEFLNARFSESMKSHIQMTGIRSRDVENIVVPNGLSLAKLAVQYSDGVIAAAKTLPESLLAYAKKLSIPVLSYVSVDNEAKQYIKKYNNFYDQILSKDKKK